MRFASLYKEPKSEEPVYGRPMFGWHSRNRQFSFLNALSEGMGIVMERITCMGERCHARQKHFFRKLVKKSFPEELLCLCKTVDKIPVTDKRGRETFFRAKIGLWTEALIIVHLEKEIEEGKLVLNDNAKDWLAYDPAVFGSYTRTKQRKNAAFTAAFNKIIQMRRKQDLVERRPRIIKQAVNDYLAEINISKHSLNREKGSLGIADQIQSMLDEKRKDAIFHSEIIRKAAWKARTRKDGWFDFVTWMRVIGISRFGRMWLKCTYFQYIKAAIPDNRFATITEILMCLRPRDFQIIREFCNYYVTAPTIRVIHLGPEIARKQLCALRKRYRLRLTEPTPVAIGESYFCSTCGVWADVDFSKDAKPFKLYGIGLDGGVHDCISGKLYCSRQGSMSCLGDQELRVINTVGLAVSICGGTFKVRCASCGILTDYHETNFDEMGPTCHAHITPGEIVKMRPINTFTKHGLTGLDEVESIDYLRKHRLFNKLEERRDKPKCFYCSKSIASRPHRLKTLLLLYDPNPSDPLCAAYRAWKNQNRQKLGIGLSGLPSRRWQTTQHIIKVILCDRCFKTCRIWVYRTDSVAMYEDFINFMRSQWQSSNLRKSAKSGPYMPNQHIMKITNNALYA